MNLKVNKNNIEDTINDLDNNDDDVDAMSISENPLREPADIVRPFSRLDKDSPSKLAKWNSPAKNQQGKRVKEFEWEKPVWPSSNSFTGPAQQVVRLEELLKKKDKEMDILRKELLKTHKDNYDLLQQLSGFDGDHYEQLKIENGRLREQLNRASRENASLQGLQRQNKNTTLIKLQQEQDLELRHGIQNYVKMPPLRQRPTQSLHLANRLHSVVSPTELSETSSEKKSVVTVADENEREMLDENDQYGSGFSTVVMATVIKENRR